MKYSVVVPCYNEEGNIDKLVKEFNKVKTSRTRDDFELILVNNGSEDGTFKEIQANVDNNSYIKSVNVGKNIGYGHGILEGMAECVGDYIGWIHADLQFSPLLFIDLFNNIDRDKTIPEKNIYYKGLRRNRPAIDTLFTFGMSCYESLYFRKKLYDINAQPTLMSRNLYDYYHKKAPSGFALDLFFYCAALHEGYTIKRFKAIQGERTIGQSSWNTGMNARLALIKRTLNDSRSIKKCF